MNTKSPKGSTKTEPFVYVTVPLLAAEKAILDEEAALACRSLGQHIRYRAVSTLYGQPTDEAPEPDKVFLTPYELQHRWAISAQTLWRLQKRGVVTPLRPYGNRTVKFSIEEILRIEEARQHEGEPA